MGRMRIRRGGVRELIMTLLHSVTNTHVLHLQTSSYSEHKALEEYYTKIDKLVDSLVETYQGSHEILKNYPMHNTFRQGTSARRYMTYLRGEVNRKRSLFPGTELQNILDEIVELINSTLYKLKLR
jgi:hypothetical protein